MQDEGSHIGLSVCFQVVGNMWPCSSPGSSYSYRVSVCSLLWEAITHTGADYSLLTSGDFSRGEPTKTGNGSSQGGTKALCCVWRVGSRLALQCKLTNLIPCNCWYYIGGKKRIQQKEYCKVLYVKEKHSVFIFTHSSTFDCTTLT